MFRRTRFIAVATVLGAGLVALALIPGDGTSTSKADANVALASVSSPSPDLLARLDAEVTPFVKPAIQTEAAPVGTTASVQSAALQPAADIATPAIPDASDPDLRPATIGASAVNMRAGPSSSAQQLSVLQPGEAVQTGQSINGWIKVTRADGSSGWMYSSYLSDGAAAQAAPASDPVPAKVASAQPPRATVSGGDGDLRDRMARIGSELPAYDRPGASARPIFTFSPGERVRIAEVRGDWLRVETNDGTSAWIRR